MNEKDAFAVWIAQAMLRANEQDFAAEALTELGRNAKTPADLDAALSAAAANNRRAGDMGLEFIGPLLPLVFVEFGRLLWQSYAKSLAEQGGKELASITLAKIKELVRSSWLERSPAVPLSDVEARLREAASRSGLDDSQTELLVHNLRHPVMARELAAK